MLSCTHLTACLVRWWVNVHPLPQELAPLEKEAPVWTVSREGSGDGAGLGEGLFSTKTGERRRLLGQRGPGQWSWTWNVTKESFVVLPMAG